MFDLEGRTVVITGGVGLIGEEFSKACSKAGSNVVIVDIDELKANQFVKNMRQEEGRENIIFHRCDITNVKDIQSMIISVLTKFGKIDALVNNAYPRSKNYGKKLEEVTFEDFCENVSMHLGGYFLMAKEISKIMIKQNYGIIVNMGSHYGFAAPRFEIYEGTKMTMPVEYAAIKGGIINLTRYFASYLGKYNIRVNTLSPGGVFDNQPESFVRRYSERVLLGRRMANVDDLTGVLLFLISDASKYITGQNIIVDGGWTL
jgi:NAD(P)-dependent dehydrogenase (short-subunit alcohol dehydrogenase family)